ncbi:tetratricopeptide repeat protein [Streptomyces sp. TRM76323]|uniref:Tetratricopeptide repeat protein n=1 Tax=Streptomyces tamarix TaxID=3078565 RepID=A0ABU3QER8_9ACTN|nr:tetratricopeptide repeat protein [Streptomyces tamarix]MDT9681278.1 tetratricopeptide repeat protein [Streptomyces tamarix]
MRTERVPRVVLLAWAGVVAAGALALFAAEGLTGPGGARGGGARPAPGPVARAAAAVEAGASATVPELAALIGDREAWLRRHPGDDASWAVLGAAYAERGARTGDPAAYRKAERALRRSLDVRPAARGNTDAAIGMGALARARGDFAAARRWAEETLRRQPRTWRAEALLVDAYRGLGDDAAAGKALERLRKLRPAGPAALTRAAELYRDRGWREDAAALAHDAVARAGTPAERAACLRLLGDLAWERGRPREALAPYGAALRLAPGDAPSLAGRARALAALGRTDEAVRAYGAALAARPLPEYALEAGDLYAALGRDAEAHERYGEALARAAEAAGHGVDQALVRARYEADHGDPERAVARLRAKWRLGHRSADVADALGWALLKADRAGEALPYARAATERGVRSALFAYHRGEVERALGRTGAARRHLEEALRIHPGFSPLYAPEARRALAELGEPSGPPPER